MIEAQDLLQRMGKKKFIEMASQTRGRTLADRERTSRWGKGKTFFQICEHGKVTIRNFEKTHDCMNCNKSTGITKTKDFEPHFNAGLGAWVESKSEMNKLAKQKGMIHIGDDRNY